MKRKKVSIKTKIIMLSVLPTLLLGIALLAYFTYESYKTVREETYQELKSVCIGAFQFVKAENTGDTLANNDSRAYGRISEYFNGIKKGTNTDLSLFLGDTRYITTITDDSGNRISGTKADAGVINTVINTGEEFYSDNLEINGDGYFAYYMPLFSSDGEVIGMTFAGKSKVNMEKNMNAAIKNSVAIVLAAMLVVMLSCIAVSAKMIRSIDSAIDFMNKVSSGDTDYKPENILVNRTDEIGEMGRSAVKLQKSLKNLISNDPLTGLMNRRSCNMRLDELHENLEPYTAIMADIDFFKRFNDRYGHACGDEVLKYISGIFEKCIGNKGFAARWGGEEFLLVVADPVYDNAIEILTDIRSAIREGHIDFNGEKLNVTLTFGVQKSEAGFKPEKVVELADEKLYYGKNHGRNCIVEEIPGQEDGQPAGDIVI